MVVIPAVPAVPDGTRHGASASSHRVTSSTRSAGLCAVWAGVSAAFISDESAGGRQGLNLSGMRRIAVAGRLVFRPNGTVPANNHAPPGGRVALHSKGSVWWRPRLLFGLGKYARPVGIRGIPPAGGPNLRPVQDVLLGAEKGHRGIARARPVRKPQAERIGRPPQPHPIRTPSRRR
jgi:hypothetical protein